MRFVIVQSGDPGCRSGFALQSMWYTASQQHTPPHAVSNTVMGGTECRGGLVSSRLPVWNAQISSCTKLFLLDAVKNGA